ncbi:MAG: ATP-dependent DNA helicase, partial [Clostridia bacterium]|nr:ATP-dependent DNA helicase [Clostridia bacterium]
FYFNQGEYVKKLLFNIRRGLADLEKKLGYELNSLAFLRDLCNIRNENIIWLESDVELTFCICRKDIRKDISRLLFKRDVCTVLTSATISSSSVGKTAERCRYFLEAIGFPTDKGVVAEPKSSPFDYDKNTILYVSPNMPYPGHSKEERSRYADVAIAEITKLLAVTDGKALILFTAKSDMTYVYGRLTNEKLPYKLFIQNDSSSQKRRLEKFRADTNSVILGSGTFWEGINIEGESLSQVIIYKLPFPVPDPINEYKMSLVKDPIMEVAVPEMIIKLKQGAGRLIRSATDKGIVSILDPRVNCKSKAAYKGMTLNALPEKRITEDVTELQEFWNRMNKRR